MRRHHENLEASLKGFSRDVNGDVKAILMVSAHWEDRDFAVMSSPKPPMIYDYGGFPPEMYRIEYPAPGSPQLAARIHALIDNAGLPTRLDPERGFDHGTYALLAVTHPQADVPVVQVAIRSDFDPDAHLALGRALAPLRSEGVLIIGSGSSYHNMRSGNDAGEAAMQFDAWLKSALVDSTPQERTAQLREWEHRAPFARQAHPTEDHLIPLHVVVGAAAGERARVMYHEDGVFGNWSLSSYRFGDG
jgi:aromatic ring-opening dioxygenase catalytic subunit (LigB family)